MELDAVAVPTKPLASRLVEPVPRSVVEDDEQLASSIAAREELQESVKCAAVENRRKLIRESCVVQGDCAEHVRRLPHPVRVHSRLDADATPRLVERAIEPEARFVLEGDHTTAARGFFLIAGRRSLIHLAWA